MIKRLFSEESGQGMVEYSLILAAISLIAIATVFLVGGKIKEIWDGAKETLETELP